MWDYYYGMRKLMTEFFTFPRIQITIPDKIKPTKRPKLTNKQRTFSHGLYHKRRR
jgi:hypothetical protein